jgi:dihydroxy-acid dehydratase
MAADPRHKSRHLLDGPDRVVARAMMKAIGFTDDSLARPQIGVAHCWIGTMPCNWNYRELAAAVAEGVREAGGSSTRASSIRGNGP